MVSDILIEVFRFILIEKSGKFRVNRDKQYRHSSPSIVISILIYYSVWGIVYLFTGIPEPLYR